MRIISSIYLLVVLAGCCSTDSLISNDFEKYMQKHIGENLRDKTGPISIKNLLSSGKYTRDVPEPAIQSLSSYDENHLIYKSNTQPFVVSGTEKCNVSLIVDKDSLEIKDYVYESSKGACGLSSCSAW